MRVDYGDGWRNPLRMTSETALASCFSTMTRGVEESPHHISGRAEFALCVGQAILVVLVTVVIVASIGLILGLEPVPRYAAAVYLVGLLVSAILFGRTPARAAAIVGIVAALTAFCLWGAAQFIDGSYDGQEYHFDAVYAFHHGWNPFRQDYDAFVPPGAPALLWPQHYPIAAWLMTALAWSAGLSLTAAKGILWLPGLAVPPIWYAVLRGEGLTRQSSAALAMLAAGSPIFVEQMRSQHVDGLMGALAIAFVGLLVIALRQRKLSSFFSALCCLILAVDIKFNAIAILGAASAAFCLGVMVKARLGPAIQLGLFLLAALFVVLLGIGFHPYATNWLHYGHPFYPVMGAPGYQVNEALLPGSVRGLPDLALFVGTTFSFISRSIGGEGWWPLIDIHDGGWPDVAVGGFGPIFGGALILAIFVAAVAVKTKQTGQFRIRIILLVAACLLISSLVTPYMWWPRFIPQLWTAVFLCAVAGILSSRRRLACLGWACAGVLGLNSVMVGAMSLQNGLSDTAAIRSHIAGAVSAGRPFCGAFGAAHARIQLMRDAGVRVIPLAQPLPLHCYGVSAIPLAHTFLGQPAQSCPCRAISHDPRGRWQVPPDRTVEDIRTMLRTND
ncbi:hypothetical protein [Novosphingobium mangrovi (ex Huang et al. 2023)]|nr:hypothetical protein [Novosphingobium mangrovi (ex Huang et al. 2023)]